jgi:hypothetical protein
LCSIFIPVVYIPDYVCGRPALTSPGEPPPIANVTNRPLGQQAGACSSPGNTRSIVIDTDKTTYLPGQVALIYLTVFDGKGCNVNSAVTVEAAHSDPNGHSTVTWRQTAFSQSDFFSRFGVNLQELGNYQITANATGVSSKAFTSIKVIPFYESQITGLILITLSAFAALMIVTSLSRLSNTQIGEILRFVCIATIVLSNLSTFIFLQDEFGRGAPLGLVRKPPFGGAPQQQWVINIGGTLSNNYAFGIQIPIYVFIFGLAGGFLRYLYKTAKLHKSRNQAVQQVSVFDWNNVPGSDESRLKEFVKETLGLAWVEKGILNKDSDGKTINISNGKEQLFITLNDNDNTAEVLLDRNNKPIYHFLAKERTGGKLVIYPANISSFYQSLEDIALLFLSPLLAIATWFLLGQAGLNETTGKFMLVAISFTVGLVTDNVIHALIGFVNSKLGNSTTETTAATETIKNGKKLLPRPSCSALCGNIATGSLQITNKTTSLPVCNICREKLDPEGKLEFVPFE